MRQVLLADEVIACFSIEPMALMIPDSGVANDL
jgi:hypothetical protein